MIPTLTGSVSPESFLDEHARLALQESVLPGYLRSQRWFGGKARRLEGIRVVDWGVLQAGSGQSFVVLLEIAFADGGRDLYFLPMGVTTGPRSTWLLESMQPWVIARLNTPQGEAVLHDALADDAVCTALLDAVAAGRELSTRAGRVRALATAAYAELRGNPEHPLPVVRGPATSSNSLLFYEKRLLLKLFRRLEPGINPDFEIGRFLTEENPFPRIPRVAGALEYHREGQPPVTLAILQALVPNQGDGWKHALEELAPYYERAAQRVQQGDTLPGEGRPLPELAHAAPLEGVRAAIGSYLEAAATLGRRTAEMHLALAGTSTNRAFTPEPLTPEDGAALRQSIHRQAELALVALQNNLSRLPEDVRASAHQLQQEGPRVLESLGDGASFQAQASKIRCHGDYHLGQVLWVDRDFYILDFEGEPTRTLEERRAKQSPLKDMAGMLRSYHYAAYAGLFAYTQNRPESYAALESWAERWAQWTSAAFYQAYRSAAGDAPFLPADPAQLLDLLDGFMLDKAFYELAYELNNRPDWVRIPLRGILTLLTQWVAD